jgi:DNA polymerase, archaea type
VVCFEYADQIDRNIFIVDLDTMMEKTLQSPISRILKPLGWNWENFDPEITTLEKWGIG